MNGIHEQTKFTVGIKTLAVILAALCSGVWTLAAYVGDMKTDIHDLKRDMYLVKYKLKIPNDPQVTQGGNLIVNEAEAEIKR